MCSGGDLIERQLSLLSGRGLGLGRGVGGLGCGGVCQ
jgi:hypothetical protein